MEYVNQLNKYQVLANVMMPSKNSASLNIRIKDQLLAQNCKQGFH
jgi:hypothetical protein